MSDQAQRVLDALMEYDAERESGFPIQVISDFFSNGKVNEELQEDYESLTGDEEKQVIKSFLEFAY